MSIINYIYVTYTSYKIQKKYTTCKKVCKTLIQDNVTNETI